MPVETVAQYHNNIAALRQRSLMLAKNLPENSLPKIALHGVAHPPRCNHTETAARVSPIRVPVALKNKRSAEDAFALTADP